MNAKEAKKIIERLRSYSNPEDIDCEDCGDGREAQGYLEALRGHEVVELVKALEKIANAMPPNALSMVAGKALSKFRELMK